MMSDEIKDLQQLAENAGWSNEEFKAEVIILYAEIVGSLLSSGVSVNSVEHCFNLGDQVLNIKSTMETIQ